ncbi:50S ribosomal protein L22 [Candidatus Micrarchaeota archaeon]|nr:50S ribosomal protein L22 [Candidatus Micrarchaeota archaeon]
MGLYDYSYQTKTEKIAKSQSFDLDASFKDLTQVCRNIRKKKVKQALKMLEDFSTGKMPVRFYTYNKRLGHRKELGGRKGRYPKKSAKFVLQALNNALANAKFKNLNEDKLVVHAAANKQTKFPRLASKGRRFRSDYTTTRIEIVLEEKG